MKEQFKYKPGIKSIFLNLLCVIGGTYIFYYGGIRATWGTGKTANIIMIICALWTIYFIYALFKNYKELTSDKAFIEVNDQSLIVTGKAIPWKDFTHFKTIPNSENRSSELFAYDYQVNGSRKTGQLDSDKFQSKHRFNEFIKLVELQSGIEVTDVFDE
ncbi:hypothetical protein [uncultured Winogradskyella sp.]|uniref:hypothetical protein n=1 Tax=uncultured Winogradskyella sp. TaxID=395353 RepID=UPI002604C623|nr:hypothetical protein [uncultured Winogradskyella sp.]